MCMQIDRQAEERLDPMFSAFCMAASSFIVTRKINAFSDNCEMFFVEPASFLKLFLQKYDIWRRFGSYGQLNRSH